MMFVHKIHYLLFYIKKNMHKPSKYLQQYAIGPKINTSGYIHGCNAYYQTNLHKGKHEFVMDDEKNANQYSQYSIYMFICI